MGFDAGTYKKTDDSSNYQEEKEIGAGIRVLYRTFEAVVEGYLRQGEKEHLQGLVPKLLMDQVYRDYQCGGYQEAMARKLDNGRAAQDSGDLFRLLLAQIPGNEHCDAHGKLGHHKGDEIQDLAACGDCRQAGGGAEPSHHQQVNGSVGGLQNQRSQDGEHEPA